VSAESNVSPTILSDVWASVVLPAWGVCRGHYDGDRVGWGQCDMQGQGWDSITRYGGSGINVYPSARL